VPAPDFDVICVGAANLDVIAVVDRIPLDDERMTTDSMVTAGGGPAATAAVTLARLGARVALCAVVGDDPEGAVVRTMLEAEGVDTRWVRTSANARTARALILAARDTGSRSIVTTVAARPRFEDIPVGSATWLHVDQTGYRAARDALDRFGALDEDRARPLLSVDAGNPIPGLELRDTALFAPTLSALLSRYGMHDPAEALRAAHAEGASTVVATAGSAGSYLLADGGVVHISADRVEVASTLGAGDVFHGALLAAILRGLPLAAATAAASAAAALSCTQLDGRSGIPTWAELEAFLQATKGRIATT
jgi:sulfofructose kinase